MRKLGLEMVVLPLEVGGEVGQPLAASSSYALSYAERNQDEYLRVECRFQRCPRRKTAYGSLSFATRSMPIVRA